MKTVLEIPSNMEIAEFEIDKENRTITIHHRIKRRSQFGATVYLRTVGDSGRERREVLMVNQATGKHQVQDLECFTDVTDFDGPVKSAEKPTAKEEPGRVVPNQNIPRQ